MRRRPLAAWAEERGLPYLCCRRRDKQGDDHPSHGGEPAPLLLGGALAGGRRRGNTGTASRGSSSSRRRRLWSVQHVVRSALAMARVELEGGACPVLPCPPPLPALLSLPWRPSLFSVSSRATQHVVCMLLLAQRRRAPDSKQQQQEEAALCRVSGEVWLHGVLSFCHAYWCLDTPPYVYTARHTITPGSRRRRGGEPSTVAAAAGGGDSP